MAATIILPEGYGFVLIVCILMTIQLYLTGATIGSIRKRLFSKQFFDTHFPELKPPPPGGYPDMGNGRYSDKLTIEQWQEFNNAQRAHYNFLEGILPTLITTLVAGIDFPLVSVILAVIYMVGRLLYTLGYRNGGPTARYTGTPAITVGSVGLLILSIYVAWTSAGGINGFMHFLTFKELHTAFGTTKIKS